MTTLSSVLTIAAPTTILTRLHTVPSLGATKALFSTSTNPKTSSTTFAADIDGAEKGKLGLPSEPISMRRSAATKAARAASLELRDTLATSESEQASGTGVSLHPELDVTTKEPVKNPLDLEIEGMARSPSNDCCWAY